ncbi:HAD-IA family hydrolase [Lacrimispora sp. 210928-DFI.3.58]|uniref:HAD-IA family hydrolase n=1 Tax=Lacrimispora sp. 210928-DFI.3.58 TaxID=2883214 RepID=UPI001D06DD10|nr:HAD-IA family hydrolase [Lacrimispora sp. 210928-DFI.3.58]MCB7320094.1 ATP-grasp domain-containing protein [Lacrimispora sp. 210928-DFI.3.58]
MKEIRILVTGVGRRVELIQAFRQAALRLNIQLKLYGADMAGTAPALTYCDFTRKVCGMKEPQYIQQLVDICMKDRIDLVMPTIDTDLLVLSHSIEAFEKIGTKVLISKPDRIAICRDKNNTGKFFESCGLKAPGSYNDYKKYKGPYPCFIKPKDGSSSINAFKAEDEIELAVYAQQIEDYIIQPFIDGKEFTVDIFCDFDGNPVYITPRERVQVRAGEVLKTKIHMNETMIEESKKLIEGFKPCGPMTVQLIQDKNTGDNYYIEINPRYGGGAPLSMKSGARSAEAVLRLLCGERIEYQENCSCNGAVYSRYDQSVCISEGDDTQPVKGVIFDLDDTLYSEKQYIKSGYKKIADYFGDKKAEEKLWNYFLEGKPAIDAYLAEIGAEDRKNQCLDIYRKQVPDITLYGGIKEFIDGLRLKGVKVGIITDGRVEGQKNKIKALGLEDAVDDIIITDELGGMQFRKPNDISFRIMQNRWRLPFEQILYIGDNPNKDFQAPRQLGMRSLYFKNEDGLYSYENVQNVITVDSIEQMTTMGV